MLSTFWSAFKLFTLNNANPAGVSIKINIIKILIYLLNSQTNFLFISTTFSLPITITNKHYLFISHLITSINISNINIISSNLHVQQGPLVIKYKITTPFLIILLISSFINHDKLLLIEFHPLILPGGV
jgi:hypothetical protein